MSFSAHSNPNATEPRIRLGTKGNRLARSLLALGCVALLVAAVLGGLERDSYRRFFFSYLVAFVWTLSLGLGAVWWVTLQHLLNAKWSIVIRRIGELLADNMGMLGVLALPVVGLYVTGHATSVSVGETHQRDGNGALHAQSVYLNPTFIVLRWVFYFAFWSLWGSFLLRQSRAQDDGKCVDFSRKISRLSAPAMMGLVVSVTFAGMDLLMMLDPTWVSSIFGVYFLCGSAVAAFSSCVVALNWLWHKGFLRNVVGDGHYHDLGKLLFSFTVLWAYLGFSQFLLIWYSNVPAETTFYSKRNQREWFYFGVILVLAHCVFPFFGLLSRHVKRHRAGLLFWSVWLLIAHYVDLYWLVMPNCDAYRVPFSLMDLLCWVGTGALFFAMAIRRARVGNLVPIGAPRPGDSVAMASR